MSVSTPSRARRTRRSRRWVTACSRSALDTKFVVAQLASQGGRDREMVGLRPAPFSHYHLMEDPMKESKWRIE